MFQRCDLFFMQFSKQQQALQLGQKVNCTFIRTSIHTCEHLISYSLLKNTQEEMGGGGERALQTAVWVSGKR